MTFAERLRELRKEKRMTLDDLGHVIGVGRATIYKYEHGVITNISIDKINKLSEALGVCRPYLLGWSDQRDATISEVNMLSDNAIFLKAYTMMTEEERILLSDLLLSGYARYQEKHG